MRSLHIVWQEKRCTKDKTGNMDERIKRTQQIVFDILCDIDDYCNSKGILYMLSGGSCLGAVRENGFIPWDDDADIMISRKYFYDFLSGFAKIYSEKYHVSSLKTDNVWARPYAKIWSLKTISKNKKSNEANTGIGVDVFPVDILPGNGIKRKVFYGGLKVLDVLRNSARRTSFYDYERFLAIKKLIGMISRTKTPRYYSELMEKYVLLNANKKSKYAGVVLALHYWEKETVSRGCFDKTMPALFEDRYFPIPVGYDEYLSSLYGDYMTPSSDHSDHSQFQVSEIYED